jgi:hypothetical protein
MPSFCDASANCDAASLRDLPFCAKARHRWQKRHSSPRAGIADRTWPAWIVQHPAIQALSRHKPRRRCWGGAASGPGLRALHSCRWLSLLTTFPNDRLAMMTPIHVGPRGLEGDGCTNQPVQPRPQEPNGSSYALSRGVGSFWVGGFGAWWCRVGRSASRVAASLRSGCACAPVLARGCAPSLDPARPSRHGLNMEATQGRRFPRSAEAIVGPGAVDGPDVGEGSIAGLFGTASWRTVQGRVER